MRSQQVNHSSSVVVATLKIQVTFEVAITVVALPKRVYMRRSLMLHKRKKQHVYMSIKGPKIQSGGRYHNFRSSPSHEPKGRPIQRRSNSNPAALDQASAPATKPAKAQTQLPVRALPAWLAAGLGPLHAGAACGGSHASRTTSWLGLLLANQGGGKSLRTIEGHGARCAEGRGGAMSWARTRRLACSASIEPSLRTRYVRRTRPVLVRTTSWRRARARDSVRTPSLVASLGWLARDRRPVITASSGSASWRLPAGAIRLVLRRRCLAQGMRCDGQILRSMRDEGRRRTGEAGGADAVRSAVHSAVQRCLLGATAAIGHRATPLIGGFAGVLRTRSRG